MSWLDRSLNGLAWVIVVAASSVGAASLFKRGPGAGLVSSAAVGVVMVLVNVRRRSKVATPVAEAGGLVGLLAASLPVLAAAAVVVLAACMRGAFSLDVDPSYYHLPIVNAFVSGTSFGDSIYPRVDLPFRPDGYPLTGHGLAAEAVVATGGIGGLLVMGVASVVLLMLAAVSLALSARPVPVAGSVPAAARMIVVGLLAALFVALPSVIGLAAGMPSDVLACAALAALLAVAAREQVQFPLVGGLAGTAVGAKTTTLVPVALVLTGLVIRHRRRLAGSAAVLPGLLLLLSGGHWFVRDLVAHGSPLWPQVAAPWGTPSPEWFSEFARFAAHPAHTLAAADRRQLAAFGLGVPLTISGVLVGGASAPRRCRAVLWGCLALAVLAWSLSQATGIAPGSADSKIGFGAASRYFAPVQILAAAMVCLLVRRGSKATLLCGCLGGLLNLVSMGRLLPDRRLAVAVAVVLAVLCVCGVLGLRNVRPARQLRLLASLPLAVLALPSAALATSHADLYENAVERSQTPYVQARRACLIDGSCTARNGDTLRVTDSPGFRLGPRLNVQVRVVP